MENLAESTFSGLKDDLSAYVEARLEVLKLDARERVARTVAVLARGVLLVLLGFFAILFLFLALGFFLGEVLESVALGFLLVVVMYVALFHVVLCCRERICAWVMNEMITVMMSDDEKEDEQAADPAGGVAGGTGAGA